MIIAQHTGEVWNTLRAVRTEFKKYNETVGRVARQLNTAAGSVVELGKRTRLMDQALRDVETMPDDGTAAKLLGISENLPEDDDETGETVLPVVAGVASPIVVPEAALEEGGP